MRSVTVASTKWKSGRSRHTKSNPAADTSPYRIEEPPITNDGVLARLAYLSQSGSNVLHALSAARHLSRAGCAPPDNKPLPTELTNCAAYLETEIRELKRLKVVVALGKIGFDAYLNYAKRMGQLGTKAPYVFAHAAKYKMPDGRILLASYH